MKGEIQVQNLKCMGCAGTIQKKVNAIEGIEAVAVDVESATVAFEYQADAQLSQIKEVLLKIGYPSVDEENTTSSKVKSYVSCAIGKINS